jgi:rRNA small subunit pseudouridine methyltransferase Nep1
MEQLFYNERVPPKGEILLKLEYKTLKKLLKDTKVDHTLVFSRKGEPKTIEDAISSLPKNGNIAFIIGGFPHGNFSKTTLQLANDIVCVDANMLDAWVLSPRVLYEFERKMSIPIKRLS